MKCQIALPACVLLWTLTAFVSCQDTDEKKKSEVKVMTVHEGIKLTCATTYQLVDKDGLNISDGILVYRDESSGEYKCSGGNDPVIINVKFRTCDNCIELDLASIMGIAIGDVVATIAIGVAVYLIASHAQTAPIKSYKKGPDTQRFIPNESSSRPSVNDHYQPLRPSGQKDTYDIIKNRRT